MAVHVASASNAPHRGAPGGGGKPGDGGMGDGDCGGSDGGVIGGGAGGGEGETSTALPTMGGVRKTTWMTYGARLKRLMNL